MRLQHKFAVITGAGRALVSPWRQGLPPRVQRLWQATGIRNGWMRRSRVQVVGRNDCWRAEEYCRQGHRRARPFFASDESRHVNGAIIPADVGRIAV
jgi:hypothetical protein